MMKIVISEPDQPAWKKWRKKCDVKKQELLAQVAAGGEIKITDLYKQQKDAFWNELFKGRCVYCERSVANQHGDIDHFRPKKSTRHEDRSQVTREFGGVQESHPGYYWLAYHWENLLLSCIACNQPNAGGWGKHDLFPVEGNHAWAPGEEANERPLLLHPVFDDPSDHLSLDCDTGILINKTERGRATIAILGLNQRDLPIQRKRAFDATLAQISVICAQTASNSLETVVAKITEFRNDETREFPLVVHTATQAKAREERAIWEALAA